jgi:hypothetical protein
MTLQFGAELGYRRGALGVLFCADILCEGSKGGTLAHLCFGATALIACAASGRAAAPWVFADSDRLRYPSHCQCHCWIAPEAWAL